MRVAVLGPLVKDIINIDGKITTQVGGIPYYIAHALKSLDVDVTAFVTYGQGDDSFMRKNMEGLKIFHIPSKGTSVFTRTYDSNNPDKCEVKCKYVNNTVPLSTVTYLKQFEYIVAGPLFHDDIPPEIFTQLSDKYLILGNFGMFSYEENGNLVQKNPENLIRILPYLKAIFLDESEALFVTKKKYIKEAAKTLQKKNIQICAITHGSQGSNLFVNGKEYIIPAYNTKKMEDPTGAGDTYIAGFIVAQGLYNDPKKQGQFAAMCATKKIEHRGPLKATVAEIQEALSLVHKEIERY